MKIGYLLQKKLIIEANENVGNDETDSLRKEWIKTINDWLETYNIDSQSQSNDIELTIPDNLIIDETSFTKDSLFHLQFDGACRNPSNELGLGLNNYKNEVKYEEFSKMNIENGTNNMAEYHSLILGMKLALQHNINYLHVEGDSNLVINQMNGKFAVKSENLIDLHNTAKELEKKFSFIKFHHIKREFNTKADALANKALDEKM